MIVVIGCCRQKKGRGRDGGEGSSSGRWPQKEDTRRRQGERGGGRGRKDSNEEPIERTDIKKWDCRGTIEKETEQRLAYQKETEQRRQSVMAPSNHLLKSTYRVVHGC